MHSTADKYCGLHELVLGLITGMFIALMHMQYDSIWYASKIGRIDICREARVVKGQAAVSILRKAFLALCFPCIRV